MELLDRAAAASAAAGSSAAAGASSAAAASSPASASSPTIDLRSDVLAPPTAAMLDALTRARIGWVLTSEDPSVNELERLGAATLGTEDALFVPNATTANLLALLVQLDRGSAVLLDAEAHINVVEWYGLALGGLLARTLPSQAGHLDPAEVEAAFAPDIAVRSPRIGLLVLENTHTFAGGVAVAPDETDALAAIAHRHGVPVHLDGARLFNASVALGVPPARLTAAVDTITVSLNKGLCAPYGGLLAGRRELIARARELGLQIGFGRIHKGGYLAAAAIVALDTMVERLADDHRRARQLAEGLGRIDGLTVDLGTVQTNLVLARLAPRLGDAEVIAGRLRERGLGLLAMPGGSLRAVVHRGIDDDAIGAAIGIVASTLA